MLEEPPDLIGNILARMINRQFSTSRVGEKLPSWRMSVVFDTDYYPVSIIFNETISIYAGFVKNPTLVFKLSFGTILLLVEKKTTMIRAILSGNIKVKGLRHLISLYRFYGLINSILKG